MADEVVLGMLKTFGEELRELRVRFTSHMEKEEQAYREQAKSLHELSEKVEGLSQLVKAFPHVDDGDGDRIPDLHGHRRYHESLITESAEKGKLVQSIKEQIAKNVVTGIMVLLLIGVNAYIVQTVNARHEEDAKRYSEMEQQSKAAIQQAVSEVVEAKNQEMQAMLARRKNK